MTAPTPGTWRVEDERDIWATSPEGFLRKRIASLYQVGDKAEREDGPDYDFPETDANAHLIAAAPLLLKRLEYVGTLLDDWADLLGHAGYNVGTFRGEATRIRAALAAARGESPAVPE